MPTAEKEEKAPKKKGGADLEDVLKAAGVNIAEARSNLSSLRTAFKGEIPDGALSQWVDGMSGYSRQFWHALGRAWESGA